MDCRRQGSTRISSERRAVGMVSNLRGSTYEEKLAELGMVTLEKRRLRGDLIQAYKIISGIVL